MHYFYQHIDLLARYDRSIGLLQTMNKFVAEDDKILDAGCGPGLLSLISCNNGASKVIGVDYDSVDLARDLAAENKIDDRASFIHGDLNDLDLSEQMPFDAMIAMVYMNDPRRDERQQAMVFDLKKKYLPDGGKMLPDKVSYHAYACEWPDYDITKHHILTKDKLSSLESRYQLSFQSIEKGMMQQIDRSFFPKRSFLDGGILADGHNHLLSQATEFCTIDYVNQDHYAYPKSFTMPMIQAGRFNGLVWVQQLWYQDILLFRNESYTYVSNPYLVGAGDDVTVNIGDQWRKINAVTLQ